MTKNRIRFIIIFFSLFLSKPIHAQNTGDKITLPIEVLGNEGVIETTELTLNQEQADRSKYLWLQVNNLGYQNKASVKINDEDWYDLNHNTCRIQSPEKERGGMAHGGHSTIRLSIPSVGITSGENTIQFRFNKSDGISNGFRIVRLNLLDINDVKILNESFFEEDNPMLWESPYTDALKIQRGKDLWYYGNLKSNYLEPKENGFWYGYKLQGQRDIKAKCASCHTQDGRDLEIFSYSNKSIIERSKFHKLTEEDGKLIASYIRSLSDKHDNVGRYGRPWNPPYQPGPELADKPIEQWAAGAGLDAVLDADKDMLAHMFPNGVNQETVYNRFDSDKMVDRTLLPLAIQFPDWKHWLPIIHPMDAYSKDDYWENPIAHGGRNNIHPKRGYENFRNFLEEMPVSQRNPYRVMQQNREFWYNYRFFLAQRNDGNSSLSGHWREPNSMATSKLANGVPRELAATSLARLMAVQYFEIMNEFNLQDKAHWFAKEVDQPAPRQWFGENYQVFETPPHFQACVSEQELPIDDGYNIVGNCLYFYGQSEATGAYESTNWYHLQLVINGGNGMVSHNSPVDYNYHPDFITKASSTSGVYEPLRYYHSMNAMYQFRSWSGATTPNNGKGFRIRVQGPWHIIGRSDWNLLNDFTPSSWPKLLDNLEKGMSKWVLNAQLKQFLKEVRKPENNLSDWNRLPNGGSNELDAISKTTSDLKDMTYFVGLDYHADKFYYLIPEFAKLGVDCQILEDIIDWCSEAWPNIDWSVFKSSGELQLELITEKKEDCATNAKKLIANTVNEGNNPTYEWWINNEKIENKERDLDISELKSGTKIKCKVSSSKSCINIDWIEKELVLSFNDVTIIANKNEEGWQALENTLVCESDKIKLKILPELSQPLFWLDAMDVNNDESNLDEGTLISTWKNKLNNGYTMPYQSITNLRPTYSKTSMNGKPALLFGENGASGLPIFNPFNDDFLDNDWSMVITGKYIFTTDGDWNALLGNEVGNSGFSFYFNRTKKTGRTRTKVNGIQQHGRNYEDGSSFVTVILKKGNKLTIYINGKIEEEIEINSNTITNSKSFYLGQKDAGSVTTKWYHKGPISEVLFYDYSISDKQQRYLEGYLMHKWNMQQEIPSYHTYKQNSPLYLNLINPNGDITVFNKNKSEYELSFSNNSSFGEYRFKNQTCSESNYKFRFYPLNQTNQDLIKYSVDDKKFIIGNSATISEGSSLDLSVNYKIQGEFQWESPNGQFLPINTNPQSQIITSNNNFNIWKLHIRKDENSCVFADTTYKFTINVETSLSTNDYSQQPIVFPNPTSEFVNIKLPNTSAKSLKVIAYNSLHQEVLNEIITLHANTLQFSLRNKPSGIYFIKIALETPILLKIIKN